MIFFLLDVIFYALLSPLIWLVHFIFRKRVTTKFEGKTIVITGGSKGIGKALAVELAKENPKHLVIIARNVTELEKAAQEIKNVNSTVDVLTISCDVTNKVAVAQIVETLATKSIRSIDSLFLVHGASYPGYIIEQDTELFEKQMQLNYFGGVYVTKAFLPLLFRDRKKEDKHITFVASACAVCTFTGYGSYAPTKYAIRAFAETLHNELQGHGIQIHLSLPTDTETEGFKNENLTKPKECMEISGEIKVQQPEQPAKAIIRDVKKGKFFCYDAFDMALLVSISQGITPRSCPIFAPLLAGLGNIVAYFIHSSWVSTSKKYTAAREKQFAHLHSDNTGHIVIEESTEASALL